MPSLHRQTPEDYFTVASYPFQHRYLPKEFRSRLCGAATNAASETFSSLPVAATARPLPVGLHVCPSSHTSTCQLSSGFALLDLPLDCGALVGAGPPHDLSYNGW